MPKLMIRVIMSLGAFLLSTAPISQTFAQVKQQEAQASGIAVADTFSNTNTPEKSDNLQLLRPGATAIFPKGDSIPVADSAAATPSAAAYSATQWVVIALVAIALLILIVVAVCSGGNCELWGT